ncbi:N(5)-(carboxyethyl)ornithine synthase [Mycobacterium sp. CVI_P3]|uniref:N(5)-(Carboxyethyl)ornithine synthase n=1 Tax=Mycobacterium pinniadriaticum TaxID=2994102 RepID=A0ABT3SID0_9MYCO|nr:N(5)-(carboxyethyl)ornithine synthase [Mycobacterium pinniadriaticum]MCX2932845.1 N(5)-(carboxyethyl)ornithine synthase [Mycobacterium pinniadriaticum]MCX2939269.1 N(5)-(carboxyethyl)ornithine synthase [Mycobacterium pinniadriaticum]
MSRIVDTQQLSLGVFARSGKENERRLPIHPAHLGRIDPAVRSRIFLEHGYGSDFSSTDEALGQLVGGIGTREQLIADCDVILVPKVQAQDLTEVRERQVVLGWPHCVQDVALTQVAIDRQLTLIAFEAMNHWRPDGGFELHVFHKNNELAGYCSVLHAMQLVGLTGSYGRRLQATVIGFGATARGAVTALNAHGVDDVRVLTNRDVAAVGSPIHSTQMVQMGHHPDTPDRIWADAADTPIPVARFLADSDIVVNCVLQDPSAPLIFVTESELAAFAAGSLIVDVSCDAGMGFSWAHPTSFAHPIIEVTDGVYYYAVDHSPSLLWNSATWEISEALLPHIEAILAGPAGWNMSPTISRAVEIGDGVILNPKILAVQHRDRSYPHPVRDDRLPRSRQNPWAKSTSADHGCGPTGYLRVDRQGDNAPERDNHDVTDVHPRK